MIKFTRPPFSFKLFFAVYVLLSMNISNATTVVADDVSQYRWATFNTYDNSNLNWMMQNNASMYGGVSPSTWTDSSGTAGQMSLDNQTLSTLFTNKGYGGKNANIISDVEKYYSSTNGKITAALFQIKNNSTNDIVWSPDYYYSAYSGWGESASVAVNGVNVATHSSSGRATTDITLAAGQTNTVIFTSAASKPGSTGGGTYMRGNQLGFTNNSLDLPDGLEYVDELASNQFRVATFDTYDNSSSSQWMMQNNASMYGGVSPSTWTDSSGTAGQISNNPDNLATLFTKKGYAGNNAMISSDVAVYPSSTNGKVTAALFQIKNETGSDIVWDASYYNSANSAWGEVASISVDGHNVSVQPNTSPSPSSTSITIAANHTSNVIFTSTTSSAQNVGSNNYMRGNQLGFTNNSLDLPDGLSFVDELESVPYRWAKFDTYDNSDLGWLMRNDASMYGGVHPSQWTDGNATAGNMSTDPEVLRTLFTNKGYGGKNAMIFSDVEEYYSSTNGQVGAVMFLVENLTSENIVWSPEYFYSAYAGWGERAGVSINGVNIATHSINGYGRAISDIILPSNQLSTIIFTSTSSRAGLTRGMQLGFLNDSLALPEGLRFIDDTMVTVSNSSPSGVPEPSSLTLLVLGFICIIWLRKYQHNKLIMTTSV